MNTIREILSRAIETGEMVSIIYKGGSQPGTIREIRPVALHETEVQAYDGTTEVVKRYVISKMELPGQAPVAPHYVEEGEAEDNRTIRQVFESKVDEFKQMGWSVQLGENEISLHYFFKNGKVRKGAAVTLSYVEFIIDSVMDEEKWIKEDEEVWIEEKRKSKRPYHIVGPTYQGPGFAKLARALSVFMDEARKHKPEQIPASE